MIKYAGVPEDAEPTLRAARVALLPLEDCDNPFATPVGKRITSSMDPDAPPSLPTARYESMHVFEQALLTAGLDIRLAVASFSKQTSAPTCCSTRSHIGQLCFQDLDPTVVTGRHAAVTVNRALRQATGVAFMLRIAAIVALYLLPRTHELLSMNRSVYCWVYRPPPSLERSSRAASLRSAWSQHSARSAPSRLHSRTGTALSQAELKEVRACASHVTTPLSQQIVFVENRNRRLKIL